MAADFKGALAKLREEQEAQRKQEEQRQSVTGSQMAGRTPTLPRPGELAPVKSAKEIADELEGYEWLKKPELVAMGRFNIIHASKRPSTYKGRTFEQTCFMVQLLDEPYRGATAMVSFESNEVRDKIFALVHQYGGVGPFKLVADQRKDPEDGTTTLTYIFEVQDEGESGGASNAVATAVTTEEKEIVMPFDTPTEEETQPAKSTRSRR